MVTKDMARSEWARIRARKQIILPFSMALRQGKISLMKLLDVSEPFCRSYNGREIVLADNGYYWLQLAVEGEHAWFTVMFDDRGNLLQIYADVTGGNDTEKENPTFEDLFLDYVLYENDVYELDRNELDEAYSSGGISRKQYEEALMAGEEIYRNFSEKPDRISAFFCDQFRMLLPVLERS
ncbi:MAG: DUF402 domain-containing protein [Oscillospiraceae bacterium]|nr:DUF402 domain-containing protein [Oscillospiraceae bacterium]